MKGNSPGHYRLTRGWLDHPMWGNDPYCRRAAWVWLIDNAAFAPRRVLINNKQVLLERGQLCASIRFLATAWRWEPTKVRRFLKKLKSCHAIASRNATGDASLPDVITICNYNRYQADLQGTAPRNATPSETEPPQTIRKDKSFPYGKGGTPPSDDLDKVLYERGKALLGKNAGGQITKLKNVHGVGKALEIIEDAGRKENPAEYVAGVLRSKSSGSGQPNGAAVGTHEHQNIKERWGW